MTFLQLVSLMAKTPAATPFAHATHREIGDKSLTNWRRLVEAEEEDRHHCLEFCPYHSVLEANEAVRWAKLCVPLVKAAERKMIQTKEDTAITPYFSNLADPLWRSSGMGSNAAAVEVSKHRPGPQME